MVKDMKKNFVNQLNNPDKMSPTLYLSLEKLEYEGVLLLWVYVPPTSTVEKCANRIMTGMKMVTWILQIRRFSCKICITERGNTYAEHKIFPYVTTEDLRIDLMDKSKKSCKEQKSGSSLAENV